ncbi:MAG: DNA-methyltransferase [Phycisphaerae bacterium]
MPAYKSKIAADRRQRFDEGIAKLRKAAPSIKSGKGSATPKMRYHAGVDSFNHVIQGDCIEVMNQTPAGWADLVFADPPFNIGYLYAGYDDEQPVEKYLAFSRDWMKAVKRILKPTGSFFLAIGDDYAADLCVIARRELGLTMRNWIVWHYTFGQQTKKKFARSHTHILYFTRSEKDFTFNADDVRVASARQTTYGDRRANAKGKLPDDTWYLRPQEVPEEHGFSDEADTWYASRVCGTFAEREGWHGCQMPIAVLDRIIKAASNPGDVVVDPFNGSGTTCVSAALLGRDYVGIDSSSEYVDFARRRIETALAGSPTAAHRPSRVQTATDAFGRPRVTRKRQAKAS